MQETDGEEDGATWKFFHLGHEVAPRIAKANETLFWNDLLDLTTPLAFYGEYVHYTSFSSRQLN